MSCPNCGGDLPSGARFCPTCGTELARRADQRRVVTVLFADIVGFTGLSETLDPEQVKQLVDRCFARLADDITSYGGRVDKIIGDAIVALFGAPVAHEDDAERAVRAALRMQETVQRYDAESGAEIELRIGINTGEVLVGGLAAGDDYTAMGDVVNIASRLQTAAEPGTVLVGPQTHAETAEVIRYGSEGRCRVRGRDEPVATWRAIEPIGRPGDRQDHAVTSLVGRDPEMALLRRATGAAFDRSRAQLLLVQGETGMGKTRLASELVELAGVEYDALMLSGRCVPYGEANAWGPIAEAMQTLFGDDLPPADDEARPFVARAVAEHFDAGDELEAITEGVMRMLGHASRLDELDPARADQESARAVRALLHRAATRRPVIVWLADLHWADEVVLGFVEDTLERLGHRPFVVLATGNTDLADRWDRRPRRYDALLVTLEPLDHDVAEELLDELVGREVDPALRSEVLDRAGGNPLFLHEMAKVLGAEDDAVVVPGNIRSVISARLDTLDDKARAVLEDAASFGLRGIVRALEQMGEEMRGDGDVRPVLDRLASDGLLELDDGRWAFRSSLVRDVAYSRLTKTERTRRHAGIAAAIEAETGKVPDTIAYHYRAAAALDRELGGVDHVPADLADRAIDWTVRAAGALTESRARERVRRLYSEALELLDEDDPRRAALLMHRARGELNGLRVSTARRDIGAARPFVERAGDPGLDLELALVESEVAQRSNDPALALERAAAALELIERLDDPAAVGRALRRCGMVHLLLGREPAAESLISAAYDAYRDGGDARGMAWARQNLAWISYMLGRLVEAEARLEEAIAAFEDLGDFAGIAWSRGLLAYVRIYEGRFAEAGELAEQTLADARERGDRWGQGMMLVALATAALWTGRIDEAIALGQEALALFGDRGDPVGTIQARAVLGRSLVRSGRISDGLRLLHDADDADPSHHGMAEILYTAGMAAAASVGDVAEGRRFGAGHGVQVVDPSVLGHSDRTVANALIALQSGNVAEATDLLNRLPSLETADVTRPDPEVVSASTWAWAVAALTTAASGEDPGSFVEAVNASFRATYGDRVIARLADACWRAVSGDEAATRAALEQAETVIPTGGDQLHRFVVATARAVCLAALGTDDAAEADRRATSLAAEMGLGATGWRTAFETLVATG